jgi:hypothetical protein
MSGMTARGRITLSPLDPFGPSMQMTTDPEIKETWDSRKSVEPGLGGSSTTYDFGVFAVDCHRTLTWAGGGSAQWLDVDVIAQLRSWRAVRGSTYRYQDGEGNDWTVEITNMGAEREFGQPRNWRCVLDLHVLAMTDLLGVPYTGE